jgi:hypothetical protein
MTVLEDDGVLSGRSPLKPEGVASLSHALCLKWGMHLFNYRYLANDTRTSALDAGGFFRVAWYPFLDSRPEKKSLSKGAKGMQTSNSIYEPRHLLRLLRMKRFFVDIQTWN